MSDTPVNPFDDAEEIAKKSMVLFSLSTAPAAWAAARLAP